ncbi:hypothetical protein AC579_8618 [Pseudocercospora musae]|uniref:Uncharacterized protein n=1 Tax=Pseudocercospora musae TaxID=113226 RepID=A0A139I1K1_9PEZI|nr:hypothetical protein AC579_8618 [Pseudocercospora musae]
MFAFVRLCRALIWVQYGQSQAQSQSKSEAQYHLMGSDPVVMVASQPTLGHICFVILVDVVLVSRKDPGAIDLHDHQPRRVSRGVPQIDARCEFQEAPMYCFPIQIWIQVLG